MRRLIPALLLTITFGFKVSSQNPKHPDYENVVYGLISGTALLMDIYLPEHSNHKAILYINGSAWGIWDDYQKVYNQTSLKQDCYTDPYAINWVQGLLNSGYTVFSIDHRFSPRYHYPDPFYDCQRAVRFIRYNAKKYNIDPDFIGAMGHSSGAYFCAMLALKDTVINSPQHPMDRLSSKVQAVVTLAAPFNLADFNTKADSTMLRNTMIVAVTSYMGSLPPLDPEADTFVLSGTYAGASPIANVSSNSSPFLIYQSDDDPMIPPRQAVSMAGNLKDKKVIVKFYMTHHEGHSPIANMTEIDNWFKTYLK